MFHEITPKIPIFSLEENRSGLHTLTVLRHHLALIKNFNPLLTLLSYALSIYIRASAAAEKTFFNPEKNRQKHLVPPTALWLIVRLCTVLHFPILKKSFLK